MMKRVRLILTLLGVLATAAPASAHGQGQGKDIPPAYKPPPGMCRIWLDGVPPAQQPAPTDCASAVRNRPSNGRVIFGDEPRDKSAKWRRPDPRPDEARDRDQRREKSDEKKPRGGKKKPGGDDDVWEDG